MSFLHSELYTQGVEVGVCLGPWRREECYLDILVSFQTFLWFARESYSKSLQEK